MYDWLAKTAWTMQTPVPYSAFHICFAAVGVTLAVILARVISGRLKPERFNGVLFLCGALLLISEVYKQLFLYYVVNHRSYDWWYFPFQLCSLPMYFCLAVPVLPARIRLVLLTFMQDFNLLGGLMVLLVPEGLLHPYWTLTVHGFVWHILLIFIGLFIRFCGQSDRSVRGFVNTLPLFGACCVIASVINVAAGPTGYSDMFYISPYYPTTQPFFNGIARSCGIWIGNIAYLFSVCAGGFILHMSLRFDFFKSQ